MENNNNEIPQIYDSMNDYNNMYYNNEDTDNNVYSSRYDNRRYDNTNDMDRRFDNMNNNRYDRDYNQRMRYYQYPYCDSYGRCQNPMWWMFWPLFFL